MSNESSPDSPEKSLERSERGRQSYSEGYSFEDRVAELFRLLHYEVEHGRIFSGRQVDLFVTTRLGDLTIHRAIECKAGPVKSDQIDAFIAKLQLVRADYPSAIGTIISNSTFTDAVTAHAAKVGIKLTLFRDLEAQLFDGHSYVQNLLRELRTNLSYPINYYIEPNIGYDTIGEDIKAFSIVKDWLDDPEWSQLTLLGDVGTGKSFLSRMIANELASEYLKDSLEKPIPILIDLRNADREFSLEGLILTHLAKNGLSQVSFDIFQYVLTQGRIVLILDGFDEMAARVTPQVTNRNFYELARCVKGRAKVLLTCRTHYFKSRTEEEEVILGSREDYGSEPARELYWELISRKGFRIAYLRPFNITQIEEYVRRVRPDCAREAINKIRTTYNLEELSQRPMLLEMIVKSIDKLNAEEINQATLYKVFTDAWIHRDKWRDVLSPESKLNFLTALARSLWQEDLNSIHYTRLTEYVRQELSAQIQDTQQLLEIDNEIRTASFLTRNDSGQYGFAHKSYLEFFLARYIAHQLSLNQIDCLNIKRISPEIIGFLFFLVESGEELLEKVLTSRYHPLISENALLYLYGFRRYEALIDSERDDLVVSLPEDMKLEGAQLDQVTLERAVIINADLSDANLEQAILSGTTLNRTNLANATLTKADLSSANLNLSILSGARLVGAHLEGTNLSFVDLSGANLTDAYLLKAVYKGANFAEVNFTRAILPDELVEQLSLILTPEQFRRSVGGSTDADRYWEFFQRLRPIILSAARYVELTQDIDPEDIASEVALRLVRSKQLEEILDRSEEDQWSYFYSMVRRMLLESRHRREGTFGSVEDIDSGRVSDEVQWSINNLVTDESAIFDKVQTDELLKRVKQLLHPDLWRIVEAQYIDGLTINEIASIEGISTATAHRRLRKAREVLKREFNFNTDT